MMMIEGRSEVAVVVIGRNEGQRLAGCLAQVMGLGVPVVYVDSGSQDGSPGLARGLGFEVLELDATRPYTAARARNEGFGRVMQLTRGVRYVQFVDGDCELVPGWLERAAQTLRERPDVVVVSGRLRERNPDVSVYNRLCDIEWNEPPLGETESCGGNCMVVAEAFDRVGRFDPRMIGGEEPELAWRLRRAGGKLLRLDDEMATHEAEMSSFRQWWRRQVRAGHAALENADLHGRIDHRHFVRDVVSNLVYGMALPGLALGLAPATGGWSLLLLAAYAALYFRVRARREAAGDSRPHAAAYARFLVIGKFAQMAGTLMYLWRRKLVRAPSTLIEYKAPRTANTPDQDRAA
jgi:GT2 family glycosyltransferase